MTLERVFVYLLNNSITALWAVLAVLLLRLALRKAPKRTALLLWALPGLRLALPFFIKSVLSVIPSRETVPQAILTASVPEIQSNVPLIDGAVNPLLESALSPAVGASVNPMQLLMTAAGYVWLAGLAVMLSLCAVSALKLRSRLREAVHENGNVWLCDRVDTPFVSGLLRPRIYLPFSLTGSTREHVLAHERAHISSGDHIFKPAAYLLLSVYWFNPVLWLAYSLFCRDMELACDERVIAGLDGEGRREYSRALLSCAAPGRALLSCPPAFGEADIKERVKKVLSFKKPAVAATAAAVLLCAAAALCLLTDPKDAPGDAPGVYLRIDRPIVYSVLVQGNGFSGGCAHADGSRYQLGELVHLEPLDEIVGRRRIEVTLLDKSGNEIDNRAWELELVPGERIELEFTDTPQLPATPEPLPEDRLEELWAQAAAEMKELRGLGVLADAIEPDGEGNVFYNGVGSTVNRGSGTASVPDYYVISRGWDKYTAIMHLDMQSGKLMFFDIWEYAGEDGGEVGLGDIIPTDMTLDTLCTLLCQYWGYDGFAVSGTVDVIYNYNAAAPSGGTRISELDGAPYVTVNFDASGETLPVYIWVQDEPDRASLLIGNSHPIG